MNFYFYQKVWLKISLKKNFFNKKQFYLGGYFQVFNYWRKVEKPKIVLEATDHEVPWEVKI